MHGMIKPILISPMIQAERLQTFDTTQKMARVLL
jgi:hypothetical protein